MQLWTGELTYYSPICVYVAIQATMETTNLYTNLDLLSDITPECVFEPIRAMVANRLARTGRDWVQTFATDNSGT